MLREISQSYRPINFAQVSALLSDVMPMFWESNTSAQDLGRQYSMWYEVLKDYSNETVSQVAMDWVKNAKRKPTPADFLELCRDIDPVPSQLKRLTYLATLPELAVFQSDGRMIGCPIELSKMIRFSSLNHIRFPEYEQLDYLKTGVIPNWFVPVETKTVIEGMPSREELLAQMPPDIRVLAIKSPNDWKHP